MIIVGVDCATDHAKVGVVLADYDGTRARVREVLVCSRERSIAAAIADRLHQTRDICLLALDAPLGWPEPLGYALSTHTAGAEILVEPNQLFRRSTDRFISQELSKTSLDVGADRIARTAHAALRLLADLRDRLSVPIPLAWVPVVNGVQVIEVYPAATLISHQLRSRAYKKPDQLGERRELVDALGGMIDVDSHRTSLEGNGDVLDAAVCILAAQDFLQGNAMYPPDLRLAQREGWIWAARPSER